MGDHLPSGKREVIRFLVKRGLGRGVAKKLFQRLWGKDRIHGDLVDIEYEGLKWRLPLIDVLLDQKINKIDALKIDVEGLEPSVHFPFFEMANHSLFPRLVVIEHAHRHEWETDIMSIICKRGYDKILETRSNTVFRLNEV